SHFRNLQRCESGFRNVGEDRGGLAEAAREPFAAALASTLAHPMVETCRESHFGEPVFADPLVWPGPSVEDSGRCAS
ncbi:hypothetical protein, partial [Amycolatopsis japonica]